MKREMIISIVTVTYNAANVIEKTIRSVLEQSNLNIEYVVKDGYSTNEIIDKYKASFKRKNIPFQHIIKEDKGIYNAMNEAIDFCTGDWIIFLNAGDCLYRDTTIQEYFDMIYNVDGDIYYGDSISEYCSRDKVCINNRKHCFYTNDTIWTFTILL